MASAAEPAPRVDIGAAVKEAALAALVALGLALPLVGFRMVERLGGLGIDTRFDWVVVAVAAVFCGRLLLIFWQGPRRRGGRRRSRFVRLGEGAQTRPRWPAVAGIVFGVALPLLLFANCRSAERGGGTDVD